MAREGDPVSESHRPTDQGKPDSGPSREALTLGKLLLDSHWEERDRAVDGSMVAYCDGCGDDWPCPTMSAFGALADRLSEVEAELESALRVGRAAGEVMVDQLQNLACAQALIQKLAEALESLLDFAEDRVESKPMYTIEMWYAVRDSARAALSLVPDPAPKCSVCRTQAAGMPTPGYIHDEGCPKRVPDPARREG